MSYSELEKIIREEDQIALDEWLAKPKTPKQTENIRHNLLRASMSLRSVFGYKNAIKLGYKPNWEDLSQASRTGDADVVELLVQDINPNEGELYETPLFVGLNHPTIVDILLREGATPNPLEGMEAVARGDITLFHKLYIHGLLPTTEMVEYAIRSNDVPMVDAILAIHPRLEFSFENVNSKEMAMFFFKTVPSQDQALKMLRTNDPRSVMILLVLPELVEMFFDYALEHDSHNAGVAILVAKNINLRPFRHLLPTVAAKLNITQFASLEPYTDTKLEGYDYPLIEAVAAGSREVLKIFLAARSPTNIVSLKNMSPVMLAAALNDVTILNLLLRHGADNNPVDGHSPLSVAVAYNSVECARILNVNVVCREAGEYDDGDCVETTHGHKISINLRDAIPEMKALFY